MKTPAILLLFCFTSFNAFCQPKTDTALQRTIRAMFTADQKWRVEAQNVSDGKTSAYSEAAINRNMAIADSVNGIKAKAIVARYGYPGYDLVGEGASNDFWAIVQHCDDDVPFQQQVLVLLAKQVAANNASGENYALLQDRVLCNTGKKQLYGTQVRYNPKTKHATPLPIADSAHVDERRKSVGLMSLKDYLKLFEQN